MYTVWHTDHPINQTVTKAFHEGMMALSPTKEIPYLSVAATYRQTLRCPENPISYGILRGTGEIFRAAANKGNEWWEIDRGYFKPSHYDGYYRISCGSTRAEYRNLCLSPDRWKKLGISIKPWRKPDTNAYVLVVPPTDYVAEFYGVDAKEWETKVINEIVQHRSNWREIKVRRKGMTYPLEKDLEGAHCVVTYNSNVAIDALIAGVPAIATQWDDVKHWNHLGIKDIESPGLCDADRRDLFIYLSHCQFTLEEMRSGYAWERCLEVQKYA